MTKQNVRKTLSVAMLIVAIGVFQSCKTSTTTTPESGIWLEGPEFDGDARANAVSFSIGNYGYVGTGYSQRNSRLSDLWAFDPNQYSWIPQASIIDTARSQAVGFSVNGKGYIGTGTDGTNYFKDMWEFTPDATPTPGSGTWTQKADFLGTARYGAVAFGIGAYGYVGTGYDGKYTKDFYKFDAVNNIWTQEVSIYGSKRTGAFAFVINGRAYVGGGINNSTYVNDFYQFTPNTTPIWVPKDFLDNGHDIRRMDAATCVINGWGIVTTGTYNTPQTTTWAYAPDVSSTGIGYWVQMVDAQGGGRTGAVGLTIKNRGFILTGRNGSNYYDDIWELVF